MKKNAAFYAGLMIIILVSINGYVNAQTDSTASSNIYKQKLRRNKPLEDQIGYTQAIRTGNTVYVSGTMAAGYMPDQLREIMNSIKSDLAKYGATMENVVKQTIYTTDLDSFMINKVIMKSFYNGDYPTSSIVEVKRLLLPQFKVEIEIEAVLPKEQ
ncbi:MAG TPA: Rid family hydrolase [Chitinophagaceae bacterium]|nr:Rid family hydrolase [Chitinophagaceae bacterium]